MHIERINGLYLNSFNKSAKDSGIRNSVIGDDDYETNFAYYERRYCRENS